MSIYLVRTLLLSTFISTIVTVCFYFLSQEKIESKKPVTAAPASNYTANFTVQASRIASMEEDGAFKRAVAENVRITQSRLKSAELESAIRMENDSTYSVTIQQTDDTLSMRDLLTKNSSMMFYQMYTMDEIASKLALLSVDWEPVLTKNLPPAELKELGDSFFVHKKNVFSVMTPSQSVENQFGQQEFPPHIGICREEDYRLLQAYLNTKEVLANFPEDIQFMFSFPERPSPLSPAYLSVYAIRKDARALSNKSIKIVNPGTDERNEPVLNFTFDEEGTKRWAAMTYRNVGKPIAICINDRVKMAPNVIQQITGGNVQITSMGSMGACRVLAATLTGEPLLLPAQVTGSHSEITVIKLRAAAFPYWKLLVIFVISFALTFIIAWFIFKPGKSI